MMGSKQIRISKYGAGISYARRIYKIHNLMAYHHLQIKAQ